MALALGLHLLAALVWVGGMVVMLLVVRPTAVELLEPPQRLAFLSSALGRFFRWVWLSIAVLLVTGYWMLFAVFGGMAGAGLHIHLMQVVGLLMMLLFTGLFYFLYPRLKRCLAEKRFADAGATMEWIRRTVLLNCLLGLLVVLIGSTGRFF